MGKLKILFLHHNFEKFFFTKRDIFEVTMPWYHLHYEKYDRLVAVEAYMLIQYLISYLP